MFRSTNVPFDQCSIRPKVHSTNVPFDQCSIRPMFLRRKCIRRKCIRRKCIRRKCFRRKCRIQEWISSFPSSVKSMYRLASTFQWSQLNEIFYAASSPDVLGLFSKFQIFFSPKTGIFLYKVLKHFCDQYSSILPTLTVFEWLQLNEIFYITSSH